MLLESMKGSIIVSEFCNSLAFSARLSSMRWFIQGPHDSLWNNVYKELNY